MILICYFVDVNRVVFNSDLKFCFILKKIYESKQVLIEQLQVKVNLPFCLMIFSKHFLMC